MGDGISPGTTIGVILTALLLPGLAACRSPTAQRTQADNAAYAIVARQQQTLFARDEPFRVERPSDTLRRKLLIEQDLPRSAADANADADRTKAPHPRTAPLRINLHQALAVGAANSRDYQSRKEDIFRAALHMDVETFRFRNTWAGTWEKAFTEDRSGEEDTRSIVNSAALGVGRTLRTGAELSTRLAFDLVQLLTLDRQSAWGLMADMSVTLPLLRGAGRAVTMEPLTQAERNVMYAMYRFEHFKATYAVRVATEYLQVLQQEDQVRNAVDNYERVRISARRARRLAEAGRLPEIQVDQALQEELRARERLIAARTNRARRLDQFKITLGLPADAALELDEDDLQRLTTHTRAWLATHPPPPASVDAGTAIVSDIPEDASIRFALAHRLDLRVTEGQVVDAERGLGVAADALRLRADLTGNAQFGQHRGVGSADRGNARLNPAHGVYGAVLDVQLPWSRAAERNAYRDQYIALARARRQVEELEDEIKADIRHAIRNRERARESMVIQARSVELAQRRVDSTELFLQAGRAQIRDVLEAQEALVSARDAWTSAVVTFRLAELELQRDMGALVMGTDGHWESAAPLVAGLLTTGTDHE